MNLIQAIRVSLARYFRNVAAVVASIALVSGFFMPMVANATITSLTLTAPTGADLWRGTRNITWTSTTDIGGGNNISVLLSTNGGTSYSTLVSSISSTLGTYSWDTTTSGAGSLVDGNNYRIKIVDPVTTLDSLSASNFTDDNTAPTTTQTPSLVDSGGWYNLSTGVPTISLACADGAAGSGCHAKYYYWDSDAPAVYTVPLTPPEGIHTLHYYSDDNATDKDGVRNVEATNSVVYQVDTAVPTLGITLSDTDLKIGDTSLVTFTFSEPVTGFDNSDITTIDNGTLSPVSSSDGGTTWTATFTPSATTEDPTNIIAVDKSGVIDVAGNAGVGTQNSPNYTIDTTRPTLAIGLGDNALKIGDTSLLTFTFSEVPTGFTTANITAPNGVLSGFTVTGDPKVYTATFTPNADVEDATNVVTVDTVWTDVAGNAPAASTDSANYAVDTLAPTAAITYSDVDALVKSGDSLTITATFSEALTSAPDISIYGANTVATTSMTMVDATHYTYAHTVTGGDGSAYVALGTATDAAGNVVTSAPTSGATFTVDNTPPAAPVITSIATDNYINNSEKMTVHVVGTAEANSTVSVSLGDGTATTSPITGTATGGAFDIVVDVSALADGTITPVVNATDAAGNTSTDTMSPTATKDIVAPTVSSITTKDANHNGSVETATIVFSEPVKDASFSAGAFSIGGVAGTAVNTGAADDDTLDITNGGVAGTDAKTVAYVAGGATDIAGNPLASFSQTSTDGAGPVLLSALTIDTTHATATFSENLNGGTVNSSGSEFTVAGTTVTHASETSAGVVTLTYAPALGTGATPLVTFTNSGTFTDLNAQQGISGSVTAVDGVAPTLSSVHIVSSNASTTLAKSGDVVTVSFTASEAIATQTVSIQGIAATSITNPSGNDWVATRTMTGTDTEGLVTFSVAFQDTVSPPNVGTTVTMVSDGSSVLFDRTAPSVDAGTDKEVNALSAQDATISDSGSGIATYAWSKVSGSGTITFSNPSGVTNNADGNISASADDAYLLRLTVTDAAGNSATDDMNFIWDTFAPRLEHIVPNANSTGIAITSGTLNAYFREVHHGAFPENITLLDSSKVLLEDTAGNQVQTSVAVQGGDGTSRILDVGYGTLSYGKTYCLTVLAGAVRDAAGNATTQDITGSCFTTIIDTAAPVVTLLTTSAIGTDTATLDATTDEVAECRYADTEKDFSAMTPFMSTNGTSHSTTLTGLTDSTLYNYYVRCQDASAQLNTMTNSAHVQFATDAVVVDTTPPTISSVSLDLPAYHLTTDPNMTVIVTATDDDTVSSVTIDGHTALESPAGTWTATFAHAVQSAPGTYSFNVVATDASSNETTHLVQYSVVADDAAPAPTVTVLTPVAGDSVSGSTSFTFNTNGGATTDAHVSIDGGSSVVATTNANPGTYDIDTTSLSDGSHTLRVSDTVSGTTGYSNYITFFVNNAPSDTTAPVINSFSAASITTTGALLSVTTDESATCHYAATDSAYGNMTTMTTTGGTSHSVTLAGLTPGTTYDYYVRCQDTSGQLNTMTTSAHVSFTTTAAGDATAPATPVITTTSTTVDADTYTITGTAGADLPTDGTRVVTIYRGATVVGSISLPAGTTAWSFIAPLTQSTTNSFTAISTDAAGNPSATSTAVVITEAEGAASLAVTGISAVANQNGSTGFSTPNNSFDDGWRWTFHITVPTSETQFAMKFADFTSGANVLSAANNIRFYTAQSSAHAASTTAMTIAGANVYPATITLDADLDSNTPGRQIEVTVEARVPVSTPEGSYSTSYGVESL